MTTKDEIKNAILESAGNPTSGVIKEMAGIFADAVFALYEDPADTPKKVTPVKGTVQQREKETRIIEAVEQR